MLAYNTITAMKKRKITLFACAICAVTALFACSCSSQKKVTDKKAKTTILGELPTNIDFSNSFRLLWDQLTADTKHVRSLEKYKPSDEVLANAAISERDGAYFVSGWLTTNDQFDEAAFTALGGEVTRIDNTTATFRFPLKRLPEMWQVSGIVSVEAAQRVHIRTK